MLRLLFLFSLKMKVRKAFSRPIIRKAIFSSERRKTRQKPHPNKQTFVDVIHDLSPAFPKVRKTLRRGRR